MNDRKNTAFKSKEELMRFGFRNLVTDTTDNLSKADEATIQELLDAENTLEELSNLFPSPSLFMHRNVVYSDGAQEKIDGCLVRNFYRDLTNKNKITNIDISIIDKKKHPQSPSLLINVVFSSQEQAEKLNEQFKAAKLEMAPTGSRACGFASYPSLEFAFQKFYESKIISKPNADIILSEIKLFMEGRNLISRPTLGESKAI